MNTDVAFTEHGKSDGAVVELRDDAAASEVVRARRQDPQCRTDDNRAGEVPDIGPGWQVDNLRLHQSTDRQPLRQA